MSQQSAILPSRKRSFGMYFGVVFSLFIGVLALALAIRGLQGKGGASDVATAFPNLITGIASLVGAISYLALKKWAVPIYGIAVVGHFVSHTMLFVSHSGSGRVTVPGMLSLFLVPVLSLLVLIDMERRRRSGLLS